MWPRPWPTGLSPAREAGDGLKLTKGTARPCPMDAAGSDFFYDG